MFRFPYGFKTEKIIPHPTHEKVIDYLLRHLDVGNSAIAILSDSDAQMYFEPSNDRFVPVQAVTVLKTTKSKKEAHTMNFDQAAAMAKRRHSGMTINAHIMIVEKDARAVFEKANRDKFNQNHLQYAANFLNAFGWQATLFAGRFLPPCDENDEGASNDVLGY